jgi:glycosyltransferase involved in cell wall biosynthesis
MKDKPAVGILLRALAMGGAEKQSLLQAKLMGEEFDVYFIVQKKGFQKKQHLDFIESEKINYIQLSGNIISRTKQLIDCIRKNNIAILFSFLPLDNLLASITSIFVKIKYVGGIRNSRLPVIKFYANWVLQKFFLDYMIFNNHAGKNYFIKRGYSASKSVVIQNCINNIHEGITRTDKNLITILSVGRFTAQKDYLTALRSVLLLKNKVPGTKIEYVILGKGELDEQIQSWIKEMEIQDVKIIRNPDNIKDYYLSADIYFLSSIFEGMPNTIMEALNYSLPVVSTDVGDVDYLVKENLNGFLAPAGAADVLSEKLFELVIDTKKRNDFGAYGHNLLINEFSEKKYQDEYINFTRKALKLSTV